MSDIQATQPFEERLPGSFRDPSGFVFRRGNQVLRSVDVRYQRQYEHLIESGLADELWSRQLLVPHHELPRLDREAGSYKVLSPELVPFVSYPFEWSFSQLKDAALTTLKVQRRAMQHGMTLKDASAYNIQFANGRPVFIDTLSFELYEEGAPWVAYRQFCQHFLAPLALMSYRDVRLNQLFRVFIDGVPIELASELLPMSSRLSPAMTTHLHLHARSQRRYAGARGLRPSSVRRVNRRAAEAWLENLASAVNGLKWTPAGTEWGDYYLDTNYSEAAIEEKGRLVRERLRQLAPSVVWDLGANTGRFSRMAADLGALTVAFDVDPAAVEKNYTDCRERGETRMLPLLLDLTNPTSNIGWAGEERMSLEQRGPADVVLALALVHHLAIGNNVPMANIAEFVARLGRHLLIEFVPKSDSQVSRLLASRKDIFDSYQQDNFEREFSQRFEIEWSQAIPETERTLYQMRRRQK